MLVRCTPTGIGDKLLDLIGASTIAQCRGETLSFVLCNGHPGAWGPYGKRHFAPLKGVTLYDRVAEVPRPFTAVTGTAGCSLNPLQFSKRHSDRLSLQSKRPKEILQLWRDTAGNVKPSVHLNGLVPAEASQCIGVHLRRGDKIDSGDPRHGTTSAELEDIMSKLQDDILPKIKKHAVFVCSDDLHTRDHFTQWVRERGGRVLVLPEIASVDGLATLLDFFTLSRCLQIHQGSAYSTFSMAAAIIADVPLFNYHTRAVKDSTCFLTMWAPLLKLEGTSAITGRAPFCGIVRGVELVPNAGGEDVKGWSLPSTDYATLKELESASSMNGLRRTGRQPKPVQRYMDEQYDTDETDPDWDAEEHSTDCDDDSPSSVGSFLVDDDDTEDEAEPLQRLRTVWLLLTRGRERAAELLEKVEAHSIPDGPAQQLAGLISQELVDEILAGGVV